MGWMLIEVIPVVIWIRLTGAFNLDGGYYLVTYLGLLGADDNDLAWLPLLFFGGTLLHVLLLVTGRDRQGRMPEPRRRAIRDTLIGRSLWFGIVLWPLVAWYAGLSHRWLLGGVLVAIFLGQALIFTGVSAWTTWTQGILAPERRGAFFAWRHLASLVVLQLTLAILASYWPDEQASGEDQLQWYLWLFAGVHVLSLLAVWPLALAPRLPDEAATRERVVLPVRRSLGGRASFWRYAAWNGFGMASVACTLTYLKPLLAAADIADRSYATWEAWARVPGTAIGILLTGLLLRRWGSVPLLLASNVLLALGLVGFLALRWTGESPVLPLAMGLDGFGRGMMSVLVISRLHELMPQRDARFPAFFLGLGGIGGMLAAGGQMWLVPRLGDTALGSAWWLVAIGLTLRLCSLPLLRDARERPARS